MTNFGKFDAFCRDSTLPVCNLFIANNQPPNEKYGGCALTGIPVHGDRHLGNLGSILLCAVAITLMVALIILSEHKVAAVGRKEIQILFAGYIIIEICEIFSVGAFPLDDAARKGFSAVHIAAITATTWVLLMNAVISLQIRPDGDAFSLGLIGGSAAVLFIGTGYIALDTAFDWSGEFVTRQEEGYRNYALYVLYQLFPLICLVLSFLTYGMTCLVMLGEFKPFYYLVGATIFFAIGQVFQYVVSDHLCNASHGKVNGALFETFFTMLALASIWFLWNELTEDQFQIPSVVDA